MRIAVLGTGMVGHALADRLVELGHDVTMGSRTAGNEKAAAWAAAAGPRAAAGTFAEAAAAGEMVLNCTGGGVAVDVLRAAGAQNLAGKVVIDVSNPLDFSAGGLPMLSVCNTDSVGEQLQREFPEARIVKALNTVNRAVMTDPGRLSGPHSLFICGNDPAAKAQVAELLGSFGWPAESILDLGDITNARGQEMYVMLWVRLVGVVGGPEFNVALVRG
jgi:8-hydroxy-5-deazaflavin:NADPH oxidoreductase